MHDYYYYY